VAGTVADNLRISPCPINLLIIVIGIILTVSAVVKVAGTIVSPLFNTKAVGAAGATALNVSNLAVEVVVGFTSAELAVTEFPTPFTDFTPILKTLVKVVVTVVLVSVFCEVHINEWVSTG
jgi:hypothetical protein